MTTLKTNWGKHAVTLNWVKSPTLPEGMEVSSAHGFCFYKNKMILVKLDKRGWDIPGGHMELGETPEQCLAREAMEEASIVGSARLIGYTLVDNREDAYRIPGKYPDIGVQAFFRMDVDEVLSFQGEFEASDRIFLYPSEVARTHGAWNIIFEEIMKTALEARVGSV